MNRRSFIGGLTTFSVGALALGMQSVEERVDDLERRVNDLDQRVAALESPSGESQPSTDQAKEGTQSVSGQGVAVSDPVGLQAGRYRVNATVDVTSGFDGFAVTMHAPNGDTELLFNELIDQSGTWEGSSIYQATVGGDHFFQVENTSSAWTLTIAPI